MMAWVCLPAVGLAVAWEAVAAETFSDSAESAVAAAAAVVVAGAGKPLKWWAEKEAKQDYILGWSSHSGTICFITIQDIQV